MSIKILGGLIRSFSLFVPPENITRPTAVQLKRRIFDSYQDLSHQVFVDLCSGSGSIGFEAWSRGAEKVYLIEQNKKVISVLEKNIEKLESMHAQELSVRPIVRYCDFAEKWVRKNIEKKILNDNTIIYLDPPYEMLNVYKKVIELLSKHEFAGELWLEGCRQKGKESQYWCAMLEGVPYRLYEQGSSFIIRFMFGQDDSSKL